MNESSLSAGTRQAWLSRLEIGEKVKGDLLSALVQGNTTTVIEILESGQASKKDIRTRSLKLPTGLTALHLAAFYGDHAVLEELLELNADPAVTVYCQILSHSVFNQFWMDARPLLFAVGAKNLDVVERLLEHGASVDMNDAWPLFSSEWWLLTNRFEWVNAQGILKCLLRHGLDVNNRVAKLKWSMLHYAVNIEPKTWSGAVEGFLRDRYSTVELLLQNGADPLMKDTFGRTSFKLIEERSTTIPQAGRPVAEWRELSHIRADADERLKELLQRAMVDRLDQIKSRGGIKGSIQRLVVTGRALDRIPLLGSRLSSSIRRSSMASYGQQSQLSTASTLKG